MGDFLQIRTTCEAPRCVYHCEKKPFLNLKKKIFISDFSGLIVYCKKNNTVGCACMYMILNVQDFFFTVQYEQHCDQHDSVGFVVWSAYPRTT